MRRLTERRAAGQDASEAGPEVLRLQLTQFEAPSRSEADAVVPVDTAAVVDIKDVRDRIGQVAGSAAGRPVCAD
jgi:hypothetical protein